MFGGLFAYLQKKTESLKIFFLNHLETYKIQYYGTRRTIYKGKYNTTVSE